MALEPQTHRLRPDGLLLHAILGEIVSERWLQCLWPVTRRTVGLWLTML